MKPTRYGRSLAVGAVLVLGVLTTAVELGHQPGETEVPPMEQMLEEVAELEISRPEWDLPVTRNERVDFWIDFLTGRNADRTRLWLERSGRYVPMIRAQLRARGMPEDLIYLAMIESGFSPRAYSHAHAAGIWQFIAETGRRYGLTVTRYVDERRDPVKSTAAALDYLQDLYDRFGSWYLAAAAYNTGENRIDRILRQRAGGRRGDDELFWRIEKYLPRETRDYVPLMLAAGHIAKNPEAFGFHGLRYHEPLRFDTVRVPGSTRLAAIAEAAGMEQQEFQELNPHLIASSTPPGDGYTVRLPPGRVPRFTAAFEAMPEEARTATAAVLATGTHTLRRGETLSHLAQRYGVSVQTIQRANGISNPRSVRAGQKIRIPEGGTVAASGNAAATSWRTHTVRRGDSLWTIARRYGVTVSQLRSWNGLGSGSLIRPGQRLRIRT